MSPRRAAIVRAVPETFADALSMETHSSSVDVNLARKQHAAYVEALRALVGGVIEIPADNSFPDCPFVEDTAVVVGSRALITRPGAISRRGEEAEVRKALASLGLETVEAQPPATIEGGDVLFAGGILFVGQSTRTNELGLKALASAFPEIRVVPVQVPKCLHLKTVLSSVAPDVLAVEDTIEAQKMFAVIQKEAPFLRSITVAPPGAANTLLVGRTLLYPSGYGKRFESTYEGFVDEIIPVDISEFHKVDGGLTCLSVII